jgi:hypothetical protein
MPQTSLPSLSEMTTQLADRRVRVRFSSDLTTLCQTPSAGVGDRWLLGKTHDISTTGVCLLLARPFQPGTTIVVEPTRSNVDLGRALQARVVYARKQASGGWLIGCEFKVPLPSDELHRLL